MTQEAGFQRARSLFDHHLAGAGTGEFELLGRRWQLHPGVFSPGLTPVTELFTEWLPYPDDGSFLEIGCGAGITAVYAALVGCRQVVAMDISEVAVRNAVVNVTLHDVVKTVDVRKSDLFDALEPGELFDLIYWNSNFAEPPPEFPVDTMLHRAFFDPGYETHRRYICDGPTHLRPNGRLLLGFSSIGNWTRLRQTCNEAGLFPTIIQSQRRSLDIEIEFQLVELLPLTRADHAPKTKG